MLKFNTFRAQRYLRSKFVEGKYLLASEASDLELEIYDLLRSVVKTTIGDVALQDAWEVSKLSSTELLIKPGEAWFKGLPFNFRSGKDQLVTGAILTTGILPVGVSVDDDATGTGKILTFNDGSVTPSNTYRFVISAHEELITEVEDPFLQNANISESTAQKMRMNFKINLVPASLQTESPISYRDESSNSLAITNFPNAGGQASPNLVNQIVVTPAAGLNGELISTNLVPGSERIDGRDVELVLTNDTSLGGGHPIPKSPTEQAAFSNGILIDSYGSKFHINAVFNDTVSTRVVIRVDKEPDQPNPEIVNTFPFTLIKRDVYATDDLNGLPQGKLYWSVADVVWHSTNGFVHESSITDLRTSVSRFDDYQFIANTRRDVVLTDGGDISWDLANEFLTWSNDFTLINPHGLDQLISAATAPFIDGSSLSYEMDIENGGAIEKGTLAINVTAFGATSTLSAVSLSTARVGNLVVDSAGFVTDITAIDDVNNTITTSSPLTANGAAIIYLDTYAGGTVPLRENTFVLAVRKGSEIYVGGLDLEDGETGQIGDGTSDQILAFIGAANEADDSPNYSSEVYVTDGQSLVDAISALDAALDSLSSGDVANLRTFVGADDASDTTPDYTSNIRGTVNESLEARAGVLTDAIGDEQEDRSAYWRSDVPVTWTGTQLVFSTDIVLEIVNTKSGTVTTHTVLAANSPITLANGESAWVEIARLSASENLTVNLSGTLAIPAQLQTDKDVIILARRQDASGAGYLHIPLHKQVLEPGQTVRLGASGSDGGGAGTLEPIPGYQWLEVDEFSSLPTGTDSKVETTGYTNATYDVADKLFRMSCDKSRTVSTSVGTALTINLAPGFTVVAGDIVYVTSGARINQWRRIATVTTQTSFTLDAAFTGGDATLGDTLMISQAVWTKDLVNFGSATELTRPRDFFSGNILQIAVDYFDSLTSGDEIPDYVSTARAVVSASNSGLVAAVGIPTSDTYSPIFTRAPAPAQIDDYILLTNSDQERLHLTFFPNPNNGSVTTAANLIGYEANFFVEDTVLNGGVLDSAYCYSDGSGTEIQCTVATPAGFTEVTLDWSYVPAVNPGETAGQLKVYVDGLEIPRFVSGSTLDAYYTEEQDSFGVYRIIRLHTDLSGSALSIEVVKSEGVVDTSNSNSSRISTLYEIVVGSAAQVLEGTADYSSLQSAINAATAGQKIIMLQGTISENISVDRKVFIEGKGHSSVISGTWTFTSAADFSLVKWLRVTSSITFNAGADGIFMTECWQATGQTITDNGTGNEIAIIQE